MFNYQNKLLNFPSLKNKTRSTKGSLNSGENIQLLLWFNINNSIL